MAYLIFFSYIRTTEDPYLVVISHLSISLSFCRLVNRANKKEQSTHIIARKPGVKLLTAIPFNAREVIVLGYYALFNHIHMRDTAHISGLDHVIRSISKNFESFIEAHSARSEMMTVIACLIGDPRFRKSIEVKKKRPFCVNLPACACYHQLNWRFFRAWPPINCPLAKHFFFLFLFWF